MVANLISDDVAATLDALVARVLGEANIGGPPIDAVQLAATCGMSVALDGAQRERARVVRLRGKARGSIFLRPEPRAERRQWAVAHELGELLSQPVFEGLGVDPAEVSSRAREAAANEFAARLLLPSEWFFADAGECDWSLPELKLRYATASHELIARRFLDGPVAAVISVFDNDRLSFRRANLAYRPPPISAGEQECQRMVHRTSAPYFSCEGPRRIQGWPVHEPDWKREILRTECDEPD